MPTPINTIFIPTRIQNDTAAAIFVLKKFGRVEFPGIENAKIEIHTAIPTGETGESLLAKGVLLVDMGGGMFDHHTKEVQTTATDLVCTELNLLENPSLDKLRAYVQRCDFFGKGIISTDPLDRAFGLPGLLININKMYQSDPEKVVALVHPIFEAHWIEEEQRTAGLPRELEERTKSGDVITFEVKHHDKKLRCVYILSENSSMPGYLRSQLGGRYDVVAQGLPSGHINILTRPTKRIDLRYLTAVIRRSELMKKGDTRELPYRILSQPGKIKEVPEWYYDQATNSIQNGGINPGQTSVTGLTKDQIIKLIEIGLGPEN